MSASKTWVWEAVRTVPGVQKGTGPKGQTRYRVKWRDGGTRAGREQTRTFDLLAQARHFRGRLVAAGFRDPDRDGGAGPGPEHAPPAGDDPPGPADPAVPPPAASPSPALPTLRAAVEAYFATVEAAPRTLRLYRSKLEHHVYPVILRTDGGGYALPLGDLPIDRAAALMPAWLAHMKTKTFTAGSGATARTRGYSPKTIGEIVYSILSPTFHYAMGRRRQWITVNPCRDEEFQVPRRRGRTVRAQHVLTPTEFAAWIEHGYAADHLIRRWDRGPESCRPDRQCGIEHHTGDMMTFILGTGLRWSEATAVRWCDLDLAAGTLRLCRVIREGPDGALYADEEEGKSDHAFRTLRLPATVVAVLRRRLLRRRGGDQSLVFGAPGGTATFWRNSSWHKTNWPKVERLAAAAGSDKDPSPHRMRHSHLVAAIIAVGLETASKRAGHAHAGITSALYGHLVPEADAAAADAIEQVAFGAGPQPPGQRGGHAHPGATAARYGHLAAEAEAEDAAA